jgi:mono/diheme cytochrome c family protein
MNLKHKVIFGVIGAMLGALLPGCSANKQPSREETTLADAAKDVVIPLEAGRKTNPLPDTDEVASQGEEVFEGSCAFCHGPDGRGGTSIGRSMDPPAADLHSAHVQHWSDGELFWIVQNGVSHTGMPAWKSSISEDDTWKLARFIHSLARANAGSAATANESQPQSQPPAKAGVPLKDKYTLQIPGGLALSEVRGYEGWQAVGPSLTEAAGVIRIIVANPVMIKAYQDGVPGNGKPFPEGSKIVKLEWKPKTITALPFSIKTPDTVAGDLDEVEFIEKDSKRFSSTHGWGYAMFDYDAASATLAPATLASHPPVGHDAKCGAACHELAASKNYIFTEYSKR